MLSRGARATPIGVPVVMNIAGGASDGVSVTISTGGSATGADDDDAATPITPPEPLPPGVTGGVMPVGGAA